MTAPVRIQRRRTRGWRMPDGAVYVGRPTRWGNPFAYRTRDGLARVPAALTEGAEWEYEDRISAHGMRHDFHHGGGKITVCHVRHMTRAECVEVYRAALLGQDDDPDRRAFFGRWVGKHPDRRREYVTPETIRAELAGRDLACWCPLDQPCHADVLLQVANGEAP